jgi:hypothetical protein
MGMVSEQELDELATDEAGGAGYQHSLDVSGEGEGRVGGHGVNEV